MPTTSMPPFSSLSPGTPEEHFSPIVLRVSSNSNPGQVAGAIAHQLRHYDGVRVRAIGMRAGHQLLKAVALTRSFLAGEGIEPAMIPAFRQEILNGQERVVLEVLVFRVPRPRKLAP